MLKKILSLVTVFSICLSSGTGVFATETEFTLPVSGTLTSADEHSGSVTGIGQTPQSSYTPQEYGEVNSEDLSAKPSVEENATKYNKMMNEQLSSSVAPSKYQSGRVALSPDISGTKYEEAAEVLGALGIMVGDRDTGSFRPNDDIKRSEMAKVAVYSSGLEDVANNSSSPSRFPDVSSKHWALGAINTADSQGMIVGDTNGRYRPDDSVSFQEAVTIIVRALGYEPVAQSNGGFPGGYMFAASNNQLLKGISSNAKSTATRGDVAQLVFNALTVNLMEQTGYGSNVRYEVVDKTLLFDKLNVEKGYGQVTASSETSLSGGEALPDGKIQINDSIYLEGTSGAKQLLGHNVVYYARIDATTDEKTIISIRSQSGKNNLLTLNSDDITKASGTAADGYSISYATENMSSPKTVSTVKNPVIIYNGKWDSGLTSDNLKLSSGNLILLDTDLNNVYNIIFVNEFTNLVVDTVSSVTGRITDKYNGASIVLDPDEDTVKYTLIKDGTEIPVSSLEEWNVISYTTSRDKELIRGYVSDESISGTVTQITSGGGIRLNDESTSYKTAKNFTEKIQIRDSGKFYLDYEGKIAAVDKNSTDSESSSASEKYAYMINAAETGTLDTDVQFKLFTQDGKTQVFGSANRIRLNGTYGLTPSEVLNTISNGSSVVPQLVTFRTNSDGKLIALNTAFDNTSSGKPNDEKFTLNLSKNGIIYKSASGKLGDVTVDSDTIIFDIPASAGTDSEKYAVRDKSMLTNDGSYDIKIYDLSQSYTAKAVVITNSNGITADDAPIVLVDELAEAQNEDYEAIDVVYGLSDGKNVTVNGNGKGVFVKGSSPLKRGDIFRYSTNTKGEADEIQLLFNSDEKSTEFTRDISTDLKVVYGRVTKKFSKSVNLDVNGAVTNYSTADATVYLFDSTRGEGKVSVVTPDDIEIYEEGNEARVFMKLYRDTVSEIVIIK